jgi:hypothetical protein
MAVELQFREFFGNNSNFLEVSIGIAALDGEVPALDIACFRRPSISDR